MSEHCHANKGCAGTEIFHRVPCQLTCKLDASLMTDVRGLYFFLYIFYVTGICLIKHQIRGSFGFRQRTQFNYVRELNYLYDIFFGLTRLGGYNVVVLL